MLFEDFEVGQRFVRGPRPVSAADLAAFTTISGYPPELHDEDHPLATQFANPTFHTSYGAAVAARLWTESGVVNDSVVRHVKETWHFHHPIVVGDELTLAVTITRVKASRDGHSGAITRFSELTNALGTLVQSGTATTLVRAADSVQRLTNRDVGTHAWAEQLAHMLRGLKTFRSAVSSWDGTIGIRAGEDEIQFRIYRGQIIDVTPRTPHGATFTFGAPHRTWADLLTAPDGRFERRLLSGEFEVTGDQYEYLRLTKTLEIMVEAARAVASEGRRIGTPA